MTMGKNTFSLGPGLQAFLMFLYAKSIKILVLLSIYTATKSPRSARNHPFTSMQPDALFKDCRL